MFIHIPNVYFESILGQNSTVQSDFKIFEFKCRKAFLSTVIIGLKDFNAKSYYFFLKKVLNISKNFLLKMDAKGNIKPLC